MITKYGDYCIFCGKPREAVHHLIFGSTRRKADEDKLVAPTCNNCHNMGPKDTKIHGNVMAEKMSKIIGQLAYEKKQVAKGRTEDEAREGFRKRYGKSFL